MKSPLKVLILEDSENDAFFIVEELQRGGYVPSHERIWTPEQMRDALHRVAWDVIIGDYSMPGFDGLAGFSLLRASGLDIPFIIISGAIGEELAVAAMKAGVSDYINKDNLARLAPAVKRELRDAVERRRHKQTEAMLRQSEERFRQVVENIREVFWMTDVEKNRMIYISPGYERIWGHSCKALYESPRLWAEAIHPADRDRVLNSATTRQVTGEYNEEYRIVRPDGSMRWIHDRAFPVKDEDGNLWRIVGIAEDVTGRKRTEELLRKSEADLRTMFENAAIGMALVDKDGHPITCNRALQQLLGYSEEDLQRMTFAEITHPDDVSKDRQLYGELIAGKREQYQIEKRYLRKDAEEICARLTVSAVHGPANELTYAIGMVEDITEKKKLESQVLRAQRLESIGTLAGGIAHDLNNVLAPILMAGELLQENAKDPRSQALIATILGSAKRGAELVQQVVSFARGTPHRHRVAQPKFLVREMATIARTTFPKSIRIRTDLPDNLWPISGDSTQLHQVLLNLCVNARDAMPAGGNLTMTAENVFVDVARATMNPEATLGPHVVIKISDTGAGIPPEIQKKIFEPFFTTKEPDGGSGLGLSTVQGIVKSHKGFITLQSEPGKGATFEVWLPAQPGETPSKSQAEEVRLPRGYGELVLVVDDEAAVRALINETLEAYGYNLLSASNGAEAVAIFTQRSDEIKAVITDIMMPVMDGMRLIHTLMAINADVRIIALSGSSKPENRAKSLAAGAKKFLPKPYTVEALLTSLYDLLRNQ
jgi:PAS domain S-box-containing protein